MFLNDQETSTDLLHYEAIARTVERFINETPEAPVTIGVHGDWGAGKSSVLKMTESAFKGKDRVLCLWFNGWTLNRPGFCRQLRASYFLSNRSPYEQSTLPRRIQDRGGQTNP